MKYFSGYSDRQFFLSFVSMDPWEFLRNFVLPNELVIFSNMEGRKRKFGEIEVVLIGDRFTGLSQIDQSKYFLTNPNISKFYNLIISGKIVAGYCEIFLGENFFTMRTDPMGIQPIYYTYTPKGTIASTRIEWLTKISSDYYELFGSHIAEFSLETILLKQYSISPEEASDPKTFHEENLNTAKKTLQEFGEVEIILLNLDIFTLYQYMLLLDAIERDTITILTSLDDEEIRKIKKIADNFGKEIKVAEVSEKNFKVERESVLGKIEYSEFEHIEDLLKIVHSELSEKSVIVNSFLSKSLSNCSEGFRVFECLRNESNQRIFRAFYKAFWPQPLIEIIDLRKIVYMEKAELENMLKRIYGWELSQ